MVGALTLIVGAIMLAVGSYRALIQPAQRPLTTDRDEVVTDFFAISLADADGRRHAFSAWRGNIVVVNFWATWCPPCRDEMPVFSRLQDRYAAQGVQFLGIALDAADAVRAYSQQHRIAYPLLIGGSTGVDLVQRFGNRTLGVPYTVLIDREGEVHAVHAGPLAEHELDDLLRATLRH